MGRRAGGAAGWRLSHRWHYSEGPAAVAVEHAQALAAVVSDFFLTDPADPPTRQACAERSPPSRQWRRGTTTWAGGCRASSVDALARRRTAAASSSASGGHRRYGRRRRRPRAAAGTGGARSGNQTSPHHQHHALRSGQLERVVLALGAQVAEPRSAGATRRQLLLADRSAPMPNVDSPWPCCTTFSVVLPRRTSIRCPAPKRWPLLLEAQDARQRLARGLGGIPRRGWVLAVVNATVLLRRARAGSFRRSTRAAARAGSRAPRRAPSSASSLPRCGALELLAGGALVDHAALVHDVRRGRRPSRRRRPRRRGRRAGLLVVAPRRSSAGPGGRRSARRVCRCPCRRRWSRRR